MLRIIKRIMNSAFSWSAWLIIPFIMELFPALRSFYILHKRKKRFKRRNRNLKYFPDITLIIPVYNSKDTLYDCIRSIDESTYPNEHIKVLLVDNKGSKDDFNVFAGTQETFPTLRMQWMNSAQGKSRALNMALYNSEGKYIINVDSDGLFEPHAIMNMVAKFEEDPTLNCMTGSILTDPDQVEGYRGFFSRLLRKLEFMEYAQAFLAGRSYAAEDNNIYTLSGAFSAFRKSAVMRSRMYNTDTICEDTQLTFQMKYLQNDRVEICEDAVFLVGPIEGVNKLYTQRQRWQRGSLEVGKMFADRGMEVTRVFSDANIRTLLYDHTFAFPRLTWYLVTLYFIATKYSANILIITTMLLYVMYVFIGFMYFNTVQFYLKELKYPYRYYIRHWYCVILLPFFNFLVFFIRFAGVVNSIGTDSSWKTDTLTDEVRSVGRVLLNDITFGGVTRKEKRKVKQ